MAKQRRGKAPRTTKKKSTARKGASPRTAGRSAKATRTSAKPAVKSTAKSAARRVPVQRVAVAVRTAPAPAAPQPVLPPPQPPRKPGFYEAVAIYERGVQALQRREMRTAAEHFRTVIERYPEERELLERSVVFLRVCEAPQPAPTHQSEGDHVYAATVALNAGDHAGALNHLQRALTANEENDHAHYIMAATLSQRGRREEALRHLQRSIALNPENRSQARQDPDLDNIRDHAGFQAALDTPAAARRRTS